MADSILAALDPKSLILSQFSDPDRPQLLQLTTESFLLERGPRFKEYSDLRDRRLRMKHHQKAVLTPPKKQVTFSSNLTTTPQKRGKGQSAVAQSVPDFSAALRKENRRPVGGDKSVTPPAKSGGSKSAGVGEKRVGRKSYANMDELKGLGAAVGNAIRGGIGKGVLRI